MSKGTAVEYDFLTRRIAEWEEIYERDEHGRERDIRDDLLTLYRRQSEIQLATVFALRRELSGAGYRLAWLEKKVLRLEEKIFDSLDRMLSALSDKVLALVQGALHGKK